MSQPSITPKNISSMLERFIDLIAMQTSNYCK